MKAHDRNLVLDFYIWVRDWKDSPLILILTPRMVVAGTNLDIELMCTLVA